MQRINLHASIMNRTLVENYDPLPFDNGTCLPCRDREWQGERAHCGQLTADEFERIGQSLLARLHPAHESCLSQCTDFGVIAAPHLSIDDRGTDRLFTTPVCCVRVEMTQEREQTIEMLFRELGEAFIGSVRLRVTNQLLNLHRQPTRHHFHPMSSHLPASKSVAILKALQQHVFHSTQTSTMPAKSCFAYTNGQTAEQLASQANETASVLAGLIRSLRSSS